MGWRTIPAKSWQRFVELKRVANSSQLKTPPALDESKTEIVIQFKSSTNSSIFQGTIPNRMVIRVQPDEGIFLTVNSCVPSLETKIDAIDLDLTYRGRQIPDAYEALLLDAMAGDFSRSVRGDELDASWRIFTPLLHHLDEHPDIKPREYFYGRFDFVPIGFEERLMASRIERPQRIRRIYGILSAQKGSIEAKQSQDAGYEHLIPCHTIHSETSLQ